MWKSIVFSVLIDYRVNKQILFFESESYWLNHFLWSWSQCYSYTQFSLVLTISFLFGFRIGHFHLFVLVHKIAAVGLTSTIIIFFEYPCSSNQRSAYITLYGSISCQTIRTYLFIIFFLRVVLDSFNLSWYLFLLHKRYFFPILICKTVILSSFIWVQITDDFWIIKKKSIIVVREIWCWRTYVLQRLQFSWAMICYVSWRQF